MSSHSPASCPMHWNPFRTLVILALWLAGIAAAAFVASGCAPAQAATTGAIFLQWSTIDVQRQPVFCEEIQARSVALRLRNRTTGAMVNTAFPCDSSPRSATVPPAIYDIDIELHAADGRVLATAPRHTAVVVVANQVTTLIPVTFEIPISGTLVSTVAGVSLRNCRSIGAAGEGITGMAISLERLTRRTVCYPTTFSVRDGHNNEIRQYLANDCVNPPKTGCIELTERLVARLLPGIYRMRVIGLRGEVVCHRSEISFVVSPGDVQTITSDLIREHAPGCPLI